MSELDQSKRDKLRFAAKLLFELPPADTLPIFKRLSFDNVERLLDQLKQDIPQGRGPLNLNSTASTIDCQRTSDFLLKRTPEQMCRVLQYESPTTIAKTLSMMPPDAVMETLKRLPTRTRELTTQAIIYLPSITDEEAIQLQFMLKQKQDRLPNGDPSGSCKQALAKNEPERQDSFHINDRPVDAQTVSDTNRSLADMQRFAILPDSEIRAVLKHCDTSFWAPALKSAPIAIQQRIMSCMAPAAAGLLKMEIDRIGDISTQQETSAREGIVDTAFRLANTDQIILELRSGDAA